MTTGDLAVEERAAHALKVAGETIEWMRDAESFSAKDPRIANALVEICDAWAALPGREDAPRPTAREVEPLHNSGMCACGHSRYWHAAGVLQTGRTMPL